MRLSDAVKILADAGVDSPELDARLLAEHFCGLSKASLAFSAADLPESPEFESALRRRAAREPLQYILGVWYFCDEEYFVSPACLIPRQETELLVLRAAEILDSGELLDLCTGSGCIPISFLARRKNCRATAVELSPEALITAKRNARHNSVDGRISLILGDVTDGTLPQKLGRKFKVITSNPPYIPRATVDSLSPELAYEPRMALDGGEDGLDFYRAILSVWRDSLEEDGCFIFEIGFDQGGAIKELALKSGLSAQIIKDLSGLDRIAVVGRSTN